MLREINIPIVKISRVELPFKKIVKCARSNAGSGINFEQQYSLSAGGKTRTKYAKT